MIQILSPFNIKTAVAVCATVFCGAGAAAGDNNKKTETTTTHATMNVSAAIQRLRIDSALLSSRTLEIDKQLAPIIDEHQHLYNRQLDAIAAIEEWKRNLPRWYRDSNPDFDKPNPRLSKSADNYRAMIAAALHGCAAIVEMRQPLVSKWDSLARAQSELNARLEVINDSLRGNLATGGR